MVRFAEGFSTSLKILAETNWFIGTQLLKCQKDNLFHVIFYTFRMAFSKTHSTINVCHHSLILLLVLSSYFKSIYKISYYIFFSKNVIFLFIKRFCCIKKWGIDQKKKNQSNASQQTEDTWLLAIDLYWLPWPKWSLDELDSTTH